MFQYQSAAELVADDFELSIARALKFSRRALTLLPQFRGLEIPSPDPRTYPVWYTQSPSLQMVEENKP